MMIMAKAAIHLAVVFFATNVCAAELDIWQAMKIPSYRKAWARDLRPTALPEFVKDFPRDPYALAEPLRPVVLDGKKLQFSKICQPHNCRDAWIVVLFSPSEARAWALSSDDSGREKGQMVWHGDPTSSQRQFLLANKN